MSILSWITDEKLINAVKFLINKAILAQNSSEENFEKNVIDPFSALFQIAGLNIDYDAWIVNEKTRQAQKTLQNHIGDFHQVILGSIAGWQNLKTGSIVDLISEEHQILAEVKNKHNTVKGSDLAGLYKSLESLVMPKSSKYKGYTAYYVSIIPRKPDAYNKPFVPSDKEKGEKCAENEKIRMIDGASFYSLVTGEEAALKNLFDVLPSVIEQITGNSLPKITKDNLNKFFVQAYGKGL